MARQIHSKASVREAARTLRPASSADCLHSGFGVCTAPALQLRACAVWPLCRFAHLRLSCRSCGCLVCWQAGRWWWERWLLRGRFRARRLLVRGLRGRSRGGLMCFGGSRRARSRGWVGAVCWLLMWKGERGQLCGRSWGGLVVRERFDSETWCSCCCSAMGWIRSSRV
jgi:hypothetical protein